MRNWAFKFNVLYRYHEDAIAPPVFAAAGDRYYKVAAEAMRVCAALVGALHKSNPAKTHIA